MHRTVKPKTRQPADPNPPSEVNWGQEMNNAGRTGCFSRQAVLASWNWMTDPCHGIAMFSPGCRIRYPDLYALGKDFAVAVTMNRVGDAHGLYEQMKRYRAERGI